MRIWIPAAIAAATLAACAPTPSTEAGLEGATSQAGRCFFTSRIANFTADGAGKIHLRSQRGDVYELTGPASCPDVDFASTLSITPTLGGLSDRICVGEEARVRALNYTPSPGGAICRFNVNKVLTREEVAALSDRDRP